LRFFCSTDTCSTEWYQVFSVLVSTNARAQEGIAACGKKFFKISFIVLLLGILAGLVTWLVLSKRWPWWVGVALMVGLTGVWVGVLFLRKYLQRRREKVFVSRVIAQDEAVIKQHRFMRDRGCRNCRTVWKESVDACGVHISV